MSRGGRSRGGSGPGQGCRVDDAVVHDGKADAHAATNVDELDAVFTSLCDAGIKLGPHETTRLLRSTEALGCHVENHTVSISKDEAAAVATLSEPRTHEELQRATDLLSITRRFVPDCARAVACLHDLLHADGRASRWEPQHSESSQTLEARPSSTAPSSATDWNAPFEVHADASDTACGAALPQKDASGLPTVPESSSHKSTNRVLTANVVACCPWRPATSWLAARASSTSLPSGRTVVTIACPARGPRLGSKVRVRGSSTTEHSGNLRLLRTSLASA